MDVSLNKVLFVELVWGLLDNFTGAGQGRATCTLLLLPSASDQTPPNIVVPSSGMLISSVGIIFRRSHHRSVTIVLSLLTHRLSVSNLIHMP